MVSKYETLKNMNSGTAKFATWCVRVLDPKIKSYEFVARGETVKATKFQCILVSQDEKQYMQGLVPFDFKDKKAAEKAFKRFEANSVWELSKPTFDPKSKDDYKSCPIKGTLLMMHPTCLTQVFGTNQKAFAYPAQSIEVCMDLKGIWKSLATLPFARTGSRAAKPQSRLVDLCGKIVSLTDPKPAASQIQPNLTVSELELVDFGGGQIKVSVWNEAFQAVKAVPTGEGACLVGCTAVRDDKGAVKVNLWDSAHVIRGGIKLQSLTDLDATALETELLTPAFSPTPVQPDVACAQGEAYPTCAAALADATGCRDDKVFQINRCYMHLPLSEEYLFTPEGEPKLGQCRLWDRSGTVEVIVVANAFAALFGCKDLAEVKDKAQKGTLEVLQTRLNVRGVLRQETIDGQALPVVKKYIASVGPSPKIVRPNMKAMRLMVGLSEIVGDVVIPAPVQRVTDAPLIGLAVRSDVSEQPLAAHRVLLLVQGTKETDMEPLDEKKKMSEQTFKMQSTGVRCLLSDEEAHINLVGYCDFKKMLTYRLDQDVALVTVSAFSVALSGSASVATVEFMEKVNADERASLVKSLTLEWQSILQDQPTIEDAVPATQSDYWEQPASKLRRLQSEAVSPQKRTM